MIKEFQNVAESSLMQIDSNHNWNKSALQGARISAATQFFSRCWSLPPTEPQNPCKLKSTMNVGAHKIGADRSSIFRVIA